MVRPEEQDEGEADRENLLYHHHDARDLLVGQSLGGHHADRPRRAGHAVGRVGVALLAMGILTGRRKIFVELAIFVSIYVSLLAMFGKGGITCLKADF